MTAREVMTPAQVAKYLQLSPETVYRYIRQGKLVAAKVGRQYRIPKRYVDMFLWANTKPSGVKLRRYTKEDIERFLKEDELDEETLRIAKRFIGGEDK